MHKALLSLGSNANARFNMEQALELLLFHFPNIIYTSIIKSEPYGAIYKNSFLNTLAYFETDMAKDEIQLRLKTIEIDVGRQPEDKVEGKIIIDIDLIKWNNEVLKPEDFKRKYMHELLIEIRDIVNNK